MAERTKLTSAPDSGPSVNDWCNGRRAPKKGPVRHWVNQRTVIPVTLNSTSSAHGALALSTRSWPPPPPARPLSPPTPARRPPSFLLGFCAPPRWNFSPDGASSHRSSHRLPRHGQLLADWRWVSSAV